MSSHHVNIPGFCLLCKTLSPLASSSNNYVEAFHPCLYQPPYLSALMILSCSQPDSQLQTSQPFITICYSGTRLSPLSASAFAISSHSQAECLPFFSTWDYFFAFVQHFSSLWGCVCIIPLPPSILSFALVFNCISRPCSLVLMLCGVCVSDCIPLSVGLCAGSYLQSPGIQQSSLNVSRCSLTYLWWKGGLILLLTDHCFWKKTANLCHLPSGLRVHCLLAF